MKGHATATSPHDQRVTVFPNGIRREAFGAFRLCAPGVGAPFPRVAMHVVESPRVRAFAHHGMRLGMDILAIPGVIGQAAISIAGGKPRIAPGASGILPLRLGGEPVVQASGR